MITLGIVAATTSVLSGLSAIASYTAVSKAITVKEPELSFASIVDKIPMRIIHTKDETYYYFQDICDNLDINSFDIIESLERNIDILTGENRKKIKAYDMNKGCESDDVIILTERGLYKILMLSDCDIANEFRKNAIDYLIKKRIKINKSKSHR